MHRLSSWLCGAGVGAGLMYFFDPDRGRRRRALLEDKLTHIVSEIQKNADATARHMRNRAYGTFAELRGAISQGQGNRPDNRQERQGQSSTADWRQQSRQGSDPMHQQPQVLEPSQKTAQVSEPETTEDAVQNPVATPQGI